MQEPSSQSPSDVGLTSPSWRSRGAWIQAALYLSLMAIGYLAATLLPSLLLRLGYAGVMAAASYVDLRERRIPNRIMYPSIAFALGAAGIYPGWLSGLAGGAAAGLVLTIPVLVYGPERAGIGDVKLALFVGLVLGLNASLYNAIFIAFASAALVGVVGILLGRLHLRSPLPFGPFLSLGAILSLFVIPTGS